jgi:phenylalanyl-tRNA synthetase alpha chain
MYKGELDVLRLLAKKKEIEINNLAQLSNMNIDSIRRIIQSLSAQDYVKLESSESFIFSPTKEFEDYIKSGFPEVAVYLAAKANKSIQALSADEKRFGLPSAKLKGFVQIENGKLTCTKTQEEVQKHVKKLTDSFNLLKEKGAIDDPVLLDELFRRKLATKSTEKTLMIKYTGRKIPDAEGFDIQAPTADAPLGKAHVISRFMQRVREIMVELGFSEMDGPIIESTFWNFDALFQPQDHPARDLADTFYLKGDTKLPDDSQLVKRVSKAHVDGWNYKWSKDESMRTVLRTHTTALSARYLSQNKDKLPQKLFAVGRVFRNEATDFKHLAEFHQVEGIIAWEGATFRDLLGIIKEFYRKLGFEKIRFRPSFFPYTEPSLEIEVFFEPRGEWLELGGAGIFRPEVSIPLAGTYPVLAWGLSLERPLMLLLELEDIRTFYRNDIDFLKTTRLKI